ncbi:MAG: hypothetical protein ACJ8NS_07275 [Chthoniobacterales bacterium]
MNFTNSLNRFLVVPVLCALGAFALVPTTHAAEPPADQVKAAGAIPLTTALLDKMDAVIKSLGEDTAAKAEMTEIGKDPNMTPEAWAAAINTKCPKAAADFKAAGISPEDFSKGIFAIMACAFSEDLVNSQDKAVKANAEFVKANNRCEKTFGGFMQLSMPTESGSSPAATP